jgi:putative hydrolase of the HAD superfamily
MPQPRTDRPKISLDWTRVDTVFLDMDGTLLDLNYDNQVWSQVVPKAFAEKCGMTLQQAKLHLSEQMAGVLGTMPFYNFDYWSEFTGLDILQLHKSAASYIRYLPGAENFLCRLKSLNKKTVIATNADRRGFDLKNQITRLGDYVDATVSSHDFQLPKERQEFWLALQNKYPFDPTRTLFVDDTARVLDAAAQFGISENWTVLSPDSQKPSREPTKHPFVLNCADLLKGLL